jgi:hypothetical protein
VDGVAVPATAPVTAHRTNNAERAIARKISVFTMMTATTPTYYKLAIEGDADREVRTFITLSNSLTEL